MKDYYKILGVAQDATQDELKRAYREQARRYHPDVSTTPEAEKRFQAINEAYSVLSNPLKRADYDQSRRPKGAPEARPGEFRRLVMEAFWRVLVYGGVFGLVGLFFELVLSWLGGGQAQGWTTYLGGTLAGTLSGFIWGVDRNFVVETFLGAGWTGRIYTFLRTVVIALTGAYAVGRLISFVELTVGDGAVGLPTLLGSAVGLVVGATLGSDGAVWEKLRSGKGRFELLYGALRGLLVGGIAAAVTVVMVAMLWQWGVDVVAWWMWVVFVGFGLGMILGSIQPPNLAAYASYASASIRSMLFILILLGVLLIGVVLGMIGRGFFSAYL